MPALSTGDPGCGTVASVWRLPDAVLPAVGTSTVAFPPGAADPTGSGEPLPADPSGADPVCAVVGVVEAGVAATAWSEVEDVDGDRATVGGVTCDARRSAVPGLRLRIRLPEAGSLLPLDVECNASP